MFAEKLKAAMAESKVSATELAALTGIHKASISQYLHGKVDPPADKKERLACALGKAPDYFKQEEIRALIKGGDPRLRPETAAKLMHIGKDALCQALQDGTLPFGFAVKNKDSSKYIYWISAAKFTEYTGIAVA